MERYFTIGLIRLSYGHITGFDRFELFCDRMAAKLDNWIVWSINKGRYRTDFTRTNTVTEISLQDENGLRICGIL